MPHINSGRERTGAGPIAAYACPRCRKGSRLGLARSEIMTVIYGTQGRGSDRPRADHHPDRQGLGRLPRRRPHRLRGLALQLARPGRARDGGMAGGEPLLRTANSHHRDDRPCHLPGSPGLRGALVGLRPNQPQAPLPVKQIDRGSRSREPRLDFGGQQGPGSPLFEWSGKG
jgi:hypothetical protein